ncbi:terminase small subunit [Candidatus Protochlamydia phocaeensis]|uniref:terminase small subunit n=1 Tax=Candidatus Protochlamydia phocaeensis TaxID=1414722 RepID=UPI0008397487|nr:terminase small subunit [Candidatus Protochlamydia phocaeensis]
MPAPKNHPPYPGCETGGRPRRYSKEDIERFADELIIWMKKESNFWLKDFCLERDIDPDFMAEWAKENKKFNGAYKLAKGIQESRIFKGAMMETFNTGMSKFALMNCHGWADKQESKISGDASNPLAFVLNSIDGQSKDLVDGEAE